MHLDTVCFIWLSYLLSALHEFSPKKKNVSHPITHVFSFISIVTQGHVKVAEKLKQHLQEWAEEFKNEPSLRYVYGFSYASKLVLVFDMFVYCAG